VDGGNDGEVSSVIKDPELRRMLEEEAKVVRKERDGLSVDDRDSLMRKRKLDSRYEEIERLLGAGVPDAEVIVKGQRRLQGFTFSVAVGVVLLAVLLVALHARVGRFEENMRGHQERVSGYGDTLDRHEQALREHEESLRRHEELLRRYLTDESVQKAAQG
jgi:hypothetical protein